MNTERDNIIERSAATTVTVWTPWGEQRVPRTEGRASSLRRLVKRLRDRDVDGSGQAAALS